MTTLRQLEYLVTVSDLGSFTRAAAHLHVSQPALSHQIAALERAAGGPLLHPLPPPVRPPPALRAPIPPVLAADDPLAGLNTPVDLALLADRSWVHYTPGHGLAEVLDQACTHAGFKPSIALRTEQTATAPILAAAGLGPTLTPASVIPRNFDGCVLRTSPATLQPIVSHHRTEPDPLTASFARTLGHEVQLMPEHVAALLWQP